MTLKQKLQSWLNSLNASNHDSDTTVTDAVLTTAAAKTAIASAITAKGGTVGSGDGLKDFPAAIAGIPKGEKTVTGTFTIAAPDFLVITHNAHMTGDYVFAYVMQQNSLDVLIETPPSKNYSYMGCVVCTNKFPTVVAWPGFTKTLNGITTMLNISNGLSKGCGEGTSYTADTISTHSYGIQMGTYDFWAIPISVD